MKRWVVALIAILFGGLLLTLGAYVSMSYDNTAKAEAQFAQSGVAADAKVVGKRTVKERQLVGRNKYRSVTIKSVDYEFADSTGTVRRGESRVSDQEFNTTKKGDTIRVEYLRDDPGTNRRIQAASQISGSVWPGRILLGLGAIFCVGGVAGLFYDFVKAGRRARVVRYGSPFLGRVDEIVEYPQEKGAPQYSLSFAFKDPDGDDSEGWVWIPVRLRERWKSGDPILVLWDGRADSFAEPDIFEVRTDDLHRLQGEAAVSSVSNLKTTRRRKT
jgi:hypothetical protein